MNGRTNIHIHGQTTLQVVQDGYTVTQSMSNYIFPADAAGRIPVAVSFVSTVKVTRGDEDLTDFTIGVITKPAGFLSITADNSRKTITYSVAAGTATLADSGTIDIPILISGETYHLSFVWSKAKTGVQGAPGVDANLLDWVKDWNTGKTVIDSHTVITPKLFAGTKHADGTVTGLVLGHFPLGTKSAAGTVTTETADGLYGFRAGLKTFFVDSSGNAQLGCGNQYIKYNASTGKVEFGSEVSLHWIGATYIDKSGIFTGTLSAATVEALRLNAAQISAGKLSAEHIDVAALKAALITAGNIEALTLNVTKGKIGGWALDADSIFRGTKNNTSGAFTASSGSVTIGSNGIRGYKWRLDATGAGSLAGGNIVWDAAGNVTFGSSVSMLWTNAAGTAAAQGKLYVRGTGMNHNANRLVQLHGATILNAAGRGLNLLVLNRTTLAVVSSTTYDVYTNAANCTALATALNALTSANIVIITSYDAIRIDATLNTALQRCGGSDCTIMDQRTPYALVGIPGIGKNNGLLSLFGTDASEPYAEIATTIIDGIPQGVCLDGRRTTYLNGSGIYTGSITASQITAGTLSADRIAAGSLKASKLDAASLRSDIINTSYINGLSCTFVQGKIGGWNIGASTLGSSQILLDSANKRIVVYGAAGAAGGQRVQLYYNSNTDFGLWGSDTAGNCVVSLGSSNKIGGWAITSAAISKGNVSLGSDGSITNGTKWKLNNDGSGQIAAGNIAWNAAGAVTFSAAVSVQWKNDIEAAKTANFGYRYYYRLVVNGNEATFYPVIFKGGEQNYKRDILIRRSYNEQAPASWNTATHKGGLILLLKSNFGGWGGISYSWDIYELSEMYCRMFGGAQHCGNSCMFAVFLRGGGDTGALYHLYSDQPIESSYMSPSPIPAAPQIAYNSDLIFQSGSTLAYAPAPRTLTAAVEEEIRRHRFIALSQSTDSTLAAHPLTYIGSTGIYTGTLTAAQVNAVAIDAGSIRTGTLSTDRLAAGSIQASKLDAAGIKSSIINTDYINGLSCTFVRGKIGGFTIGSDHMTVGTIGAVGATPLQMRSAAAGSGYWYTGAYKPLGVCLTWHQNNNAGHIVFGQIAASGSTVKTGFIGLQMMAWDGMEYFCLSANYSRTGSKEVYNRIAGWAFDHNHLWKNNISLGSDGSITNGTKWRLCNDGSGQIANGGISWNAAGSVVFAASVSVQWTTGITTAQELASAMAFGKMLYRDPTFWNGNNSMRVYNNSNNGTVTHTRMTDATAPNDSKYVIKIQTSGTASPGNGGFCFGTACSNRKVFITRIIAKIPTGHNLQFATNSIGTNGSNRWLTANAGTGDWKEYVFKVVCGTSNFSSTNYFYIDGTQGTSSVPVIWYLAYATVFDLTSTEKYPTTIDANGIYTGMVRAGQIAVDSALVVGGSTYNGSISVRDAGNAVKVTLDRTGITATAGKIGGWTLGTSSLTASNPASGHRVVMTSGGYLYNDDPSTSKDFWGLKADGSATFGCGRISFAADGSGYLANQNIKWDASGNVTMTGTINANAGTIGGFVIGQGRIGSTATGSGSGGGLAIYDDLFRVGNTISYILFGANTFPASSGGTCATGRIVNSQLNSYLNNYGLYIDVKNGYRNYGVWSNAALVAPACIGNKIKSIYFTGNGYTIDFSQYNIFFVYADKKYSVNLPTASSVASMFGYSSLPSDFACIFTLIYNYNWGNSLVFNNIRNHNGDLANYTIAKGDSITLLCANYPSFHYQILNHTS